MAFRYEESTFILILIITIGTLSFKYNAPAHNFIGGLLYNR